MSVIRVVTTILPITAKPEDGENLLRPADLGKTVEVRNELIVDPRTGMKYVMQTAFCVVEPNRSNENISGISYLPDRTNSLNNAKNCYNLSVPNIISGEKVSKMLKSAAVMSQKTNIHNTSSLKANLNLKKMREDIQRSLFEKRLKLLKPLLKYFVDDSECLICGCFLNESSRNSVLTHMGMHVRSNDYMCQICDKSFSSAEVLYRHSTQHKDIKYNCPKCKNSFTRKYFLSIHIAKVHSHSVSEQSKKENNAVNEKSVPAFLACTICKEKLTSLTMIINHKNIHSGKEGYLCLVCNKSFLTSRLLQYHSHFRILCKKYFHSKAAMRKLQKHEQLRQKNQNLYKCNVCEKKFNFKRSYITHLKLHPS